ncbi:hypothetical protein B0H14DRAFT_3160393 [Mycena olivaceomarginata]|nr:hypothetical protein B0H14DRAFT_3160393 [Mycena olivaceomarginata]
MAKGLSNGSKVRYGRGPHKNRTVLLNKTSTQQAASQRKINRQFQALTALQRQEDVDMEDVALHPSDYINLEDNDMDNDTWDSPTDRASSHIAEETFLQSRAGGEAIFQQMLDGLRPGREDPRVRNSRLQTQIDAWAVQLPLLVDAYLEYRYKGPAPVDKNTSWVLEIISLSEKGLKTFSHPPGTSRANAALIKHGYIGASPEQPVLAFPLHLFEVYRQQHRVCPRYSMEALARTLQHLHLVPRRSYLSEQLSSAYDAYLAIMREVDARVDAAMGRTGDWHSQNVCPPCFYKTDGEPHLKYKFLGTMDGNNSLKLVDTPFRPGLRPDNRQSTSPRWITPEQVDVYKDEVAIAQAKRRKKTTVTPGTAATSAPLAPPTTTIPTTSATPTTAVGVSPSLPPMTENTASDDEDDDIAWLNINELEPARSRNSKNASIHAWSVGALLHPKQERKCSHSLQCQGFFCRMKYPLTIVRRLLDTYGADIGLGYNIMCAFFGTLRRSSLGARVTALRMRGVVPSFHGHAHNRECQLGWHPLYVEGMGTEDFEECERTFALSNNLAAVTRLASPFHRHQQIEEHFNFHDLDKHASSGRFIFQNYRHALEKLDTNAQQLSVLENRTKTSAQDYEDFLLAERAYFESRKKEPEQVSVTSDYMDLLQKLQDAVQESAAAKKTYNQLDHYIVNLGWQRAEIALCRRRYQTTHNRVLGVEEAVVLFEEEHAIEDRWTPDSRQYKDALVMLGERKYQRALDRLELLVVKRLFELTKLGMSNISYKMREKLSKALRTRADAIRTALDQYNAAAAQLNPPRERLTWLSVIDTVSLAEFDLLRDTRTDIRSVAWANPVNREAMVLYFGIKRAKEEVLRLNVEMRRLITFMADDHVDFIHAIRTHIAVNPHLAHELSQRWTHRDRIHASIAAPPPQNESTTWVLGVDLSWAANWAGSYT